MEYFVRSISTRIGLKLTVDDERLRVVDAGDQVDDVIGSMVNKSVIVHVSMEREKRRFLDIEPDD